MVGAMTAASGSLSVNPDVVLRPHAEMPMVLGCNNAADCLDVSYSVEGQTFRFGGRRSGLYYK